MIGTFFVALLVVLSLVLIGAFIIFIFEMLDEREYEKEEQTRIWRGGKR